MKIVKGLGTLAVMTATHASVALANAPTGDGPPDYSGISWMYYIMIAVVLGYGAYDIFLNKS